MKYSDQFVDWLVEDGYTHCFFVAGGNVMHLLDSVRTRMTCVPFVHEVAAGIAAEYFNEAADPGAGRAFALVTAGPGLTNVLTAMAGAFLESRELLVVGGQVKSSDLAGGGLRQRGIQEIDGMALAAPVSVRTLQIAEPLGRSVVLDAVRAGRKGRPGPVFVEFCLDAQAAVVEDGVDAAVPAQDSGDLSAGATLVRPLVDEVVAAVRAARRPVVLLGGGVSRAAARQLLPGLTRLGLPVATTWNAADRIDSSHPLYLGRPDTWGMRWSNVILQQADVVLAVGTRLGLQQTGFNWHGFAPLARVIQVDIDPAELGKGHPRVDIAVEADAGAFLEEVLHGLEAGSGLSETAGRWGEWLDFSREVAGLLPLSDPANTHADGYLDPYELVEELSARLGSDDVVVPCSSGGAFTVMMQAFGQQDGQVIVSDRGLASMGYGLGGAIGAALAHRDRRTVLVEGDGGFAQNMQEIGTVAAQGLNLKMVLFSNEGYASIRMTQRNYFNAAYVGCDTSTGLGLPAWPALFAAYGVPARVLDPDQPFDDETMALLDDPGPAALIVPVDPEQTYFPKITSRVTASGGMESSPLHLMHPTMEGELARHVLKYLAEEADR